MKRFMTMTALCMLCSCIPHDQGDTAPGEPQATGPGADPLPAGIILNDRTVTGINCDVNQDCDDGQFCTFDVCQNIDGTDVCVYFGVDCRDGIDSTIDGCDEVNDTCIHIDCTPADPDPCITYLGFNTCLEIQRPCNQPLPDGTLCISDGDPCTEDICDQATGQTSHPPIDCDDLDACTEDFCDGGECFNEPIDCDDGQVCTEDTCNPETGCNNESIDCDDDLPCTVDECIDQDGAPVCVNEPIDCNDDDLCTVDECIDGECINTLIDLQLGADFASGSRRKQKDGDPLMDAIRTSLESMMQQNLTEGPPPEWNPGSATGWHRD